MSWLEAIEGSIEKWEKIRELVGDEGFCDPKQFRKVRKLALGDCPMCKFRDDTIYWYPPKGSLACSDCIVGFYFDSSCSFSVFEKLTLELHLEVDWVGKAEKAAIKTAISDILTRLRELRYWVSNIREA